MSILKSCRTRARIVAVADLISGVIFIFTSIGVACELQTLGAIGSEASLKSLIVVNDIHSPLGVNSYLHEYVQPGAGVLLSFGCIQLIASYYLWQGTQKMKLPNDALQCTSNWINISKSICGVLSYGSMQSIFFTKSGSILSYCLIHLVLRAIAIVFVKDFKYKLNDRVYQRMEIM